MCNVTKNEAFVFDHYTTGSVGIYFDSNQAGKKQVILYTVGSDYFDMESDYALAFEIRNGRKMVVK